MSLPASLDLRPLIVWIGRTIETTGTLLKLFTHITKLVYSKCSSYLFVGYENYNLMRVDPTLCFLSRLGMPNHVMERTSADTTDPDMEAAERLVLLYINHISA